MFLLLRRHRAYVATTTLVLAVSTGVNLVVFIVVNALWVRPMPLPNPERLMTLPASITFGTADLRHPAFELFEGGVAGQIVINESFEPGRRLPQIQLAGNDLETVSVTVNYFGVLGLAIRGRDFTQDDDKEEAEPVAIISHRLWSRLFNRRLEAVGAVLPSAPLPIRIVGIAPEDFTGVRRGERAELWIPLSVGRRVLPANRSGTLLVLARLGDLQSLPPLLHRFEELWPGLLRRFQTSFTPVSEVFGTPAAPTVVIRESNTFLVASTLALIVLLGGCATTAALVLVHYERRRGEFAVRLSLGASSHQMLFERVRELAVIAGMGASSGILVAILGARMIRFFSLPGGVDISRLDLTIDWRVLCVSGVAVLVTLFAAAAWPIVRSSRVRLAGEVVAGAHATTLGSLRIRQTLLSVQVCTAVVVLVTAVLFVRSVINGFGAAAGFDVNSTAFVSARVERTGPVGGVERLLAWYADRSSKVIAALRPLSGVNDVAEGISPIGSDALLRTAVRSIRGRDQEHQLSIGRLTGSPELLRVLGVPIVGGRALTAADFAGLPPAPGTPAVVTHSMAERLWPGGGAIGQTLKVPEGLFLVVGICRDFAFGSLATPASGVLVTAGPVGSDYASFVVRTDHPERVAAMAPSLVQAQAVRAVTGRDAVATDIGRQRLGAWTFSGFGLAALILGVGGTFGLVAYLAESRRREFATRLALGADPTHVMRLGLFASLVPVSVGVTAGLALGAMLSGLVAAQLVGINRLDLASYGVVAAVMLGSAVIAGLTGAWRLRRVIPAESLRTS